MGSVSLIFALQLSHLRHQRGISEGSIMQLRALTVAVGAFGARLWGGLGPAIIGASTEVLAAGVYDLEEHALRSRLQWLQSAVNHVPTAQLSHACVCACA